MSEFTHDNFLGCTDDELSALNTALDALNAAENYDDVPEYLHAERAFENDKRNAEDICNVFNGELDVETILSGVLELCRARGGSGEHALRAIAALDNV